MRRFGVIFTSLFVLVLMSCSSDEIEMSGADVELINAVRSAAPDNTLDYWIIPDGSDFDAIPQDPQNPITAEKVELGKFMFFEPGILTEALNPDAIGTVSCSSCHVPESGFKPGRSQGIGDGAMGHGAFGEGRFKRPEYDETELDVQVVRPLSVVNVAYSAEVTQWNGQHGAVGPNQGTEHLWEGNAELVGNYMGLHGLESQNIQGLITHRMSINEDVLTELGYKEMFDAAFPDEPIETRYSDLNLSFALSAYLRSVTSDDAPFQEWLEGDMDAMTDQEKRGAQVFFTKANCTSCHSGKAFSATNFFAIGVNDLADGPSFNEGSSSTEFRNLGRGGFTRNPDDNYKFKVPTLYNLRNSQFFFHGSSHRSIRSVVEYFNDAIPDNPRVPAEQIATQFFPLNLSELEIDDLTAFLENALFDPNIMEHVPESLPSGNCFPNNDEIARKQICGEDLQ